MYTHYMISLIVGTTYIRTIWCRSS